MSTLFFENCLLFYENMVLFSKEGGKVIGDRIKEIRTAKKITQEELAQKCELNRNSIYKYEKNETVPKFTHIEKIAAALEVTVSFLIGYDVDDTSSNPFWWCDLESMLRQVGYSTGFNEDSQRDERYSWINYPDGTLEVTKDELKELHNSAAEYMRFKLEELKKKHAQDFRPGKANRKQ